jgi:hypothetical protein
VLIGAVSDDEASIRRFVDRGGFGFPVAMLSDEVAAAYGIDAIPTLVIIRANGHIERTLVGGASAAELRRMLDLTG